MKYVQFNLVILSFTYISIFGKFHSFKGDQATISFFNTSTFTLVFLTYLFFNVFVYSVIWGSAEKFIDWPRYSHGIWQNEIYIEVSWKVHRLTKIVSWKVTKWGLFFNIVHLAVHTLPSVLQCLDPNDQKSHQQQIWYHHMNFLAHPQTYIHLYIYIFYKIERKNSTESFNYEFISGWWRTSSDGDRNSIVHLNLIQAGLYCFWPEENF